MATTIADLVVKIGADISGLKDATKKIDGEFSGIVNAGNKMKAIGGVMTTYIIAPLLAVGTAAVTMAASVDKGVREVVTLLGLTGAEAETMTTKLKNGVAAVSNEVGIAQSVITEGLYNAISAGVPEENVFDFMIVASQAAIAGVTDVNTAVDGITTAINAYGLSATDAQQVSDSMFAAVQGGKTTFGELSAALFNVAPAAAAAGVSMQEVNAGIATLTASGVPTSVATTQLRAALTGLQRPSEDLDKIFQKLGYQSAQVAIESEGLGFALDAVKDASNGNNGELQRLLGSVEAVAAANVIAGTGAEKFADELDRQSKAAGSTQKAFDLMQKSTSAQFQKTVTMLQNIAIALGDKLLPLFNSFLEVVQDVLLWFSELSDGWQTAIGIIAGVAAAIGPVLLVLGKLATLMPAIATGFAVLTGPIGLTIAAIVALGTAVYAIYDNWDGIVMWFEDMWYKIKMVHLLAAQGILEIVKDLFSWIPGSETLFAGLSTAINGMIDGAQIERESQLAERAVNAAAREAEALALEGETATDNLESAGVAGVDAGTAIQSGMQTATESVQSLGEQVADILAQMGAETESGKRELAFLMKLDGKSALETEIEEIEQALSALANDTTISIDDQRVIDLQGALQTAKDKLDQVNKADIFKTGLEAAMNDLATLGSDITENEIKTLQDKINELGTQARTSEDFRALVALQSSLDATMDAAESGEDALDAFFDLAADDMRKFEALNAFEDQIADIDSMFTGEEALQKKIEAVWKAVGDGAMTLEDGTALVEAYNAEFRETRNLGADIIAGAQSLFKTHMPNLSKAFEASKNAVIDFKAAFKGDNDKSFLENLGSGFTNIAAAIQSAKGFMEDFGNAAGMVLGGLDLIVPGLGTAITGLSAVFEQLGIDVSGALQSISNSIANLLGFQGGGGSNPLLAEARKLAEGFKLSGLSQEEIAKKLFEALGAQGLTESMAAAIAGEQFGGPKSGDDPFLKYLDWLGIWDNDGDAKARRAASKLFAETVNKGITGLDGIQKYVFDFLRNNKYEGFGGNVIDAAYWSTTYMPELFNKLLEFGIDPAAGNIPHLAKGGLAFGEMLALVGDNPNAGADPEIISPLSKLNEMLVQPTLDAVASMMGSGGGTSQYIYVTLDGRVLAESAFYNLPDVVRMNTGGLA